ncbi:CDP-alcohol phosphatidyltransferase family protein [Streptomyces lonarensis]|uniref:CDP-alcohol phosphatidyltransferase family protein n=2 Tax=Streptomyces lonarensis TaxID=700599 RepID=A0A7X6D1S0_9ACTN|nr:CDP-alcohol phosphatidyltransferase family protein [Streptomyces lonarensis]
MRQDIPPMTSVRQITQKKRDAWWTVLLVDPVATPLVRWTAVWTRFTPNQITWMALFLGLGAAACFAMGSWTWLLAGALLYHLSFVLDCMDGKLARLTGTGSVFGAWLDYVFDRIRVLACAVALMGGQYARTGDVVYIWLALAVVFLDMLRYIDALQIFKVRHEMRKQIKARAERAAAADNAIELAFMEDLLRDNPEADTELDDAQRRGARTGEIARAASQEPGDTAGVPAQRAAAPGADRSVVDLHREFRSRFPWYLRARSFLLRHRVRTHLVSGIEFQMAVFIVAPLFNAIIPVTVAAGALLLVFELAIIYKLQLSTRDFARTIADFDAQERQRLSQEEQAAEELVPEQVSDATARAQEEAGSR